MVDFFAVLPLESKYQNYVFSPSFKNNYSLPRTFYRPLCVIGFLVFWLTST